MIRGYVRETSETAQSEAQLQALISDGVSEDLVTIESKQGNSSLKTIPLEKGDKLVVWRLDVLGFMINELRDYLNHLRDKGIFIKSIQDTIDTSVDQQESKAVYKGINASADNEMAIKKSRIKIGIKSARDAGRKATRPRIIEGEKEIEVKKLLSEGHNKSEICRRLNISLKTFYNWEKKNYRF
jgi:hypothetical protein